MIYWSWHCSWCFGCQRLSRWREDSCLLCIRLVICVYKITKVLTGLRKNAYFIASSESTLATSDLATVLKWVRLRFCFLVFLVKMWLLKACFLLIFPDPVRANLFLAPELVLILGIWVKNLLVVWFYIFVAVMTRAKRRRRCLLIQMRGESYFFLGESMMIILFPSSTGICSTLPYSSRSLAKRRSRTSPCSLKRIERPLKNT